MLALLLLPLLLLTLLLSLSMRLTAMRIHSGKPRWARGIVKTRVPWSRKYSRISLAEFLDGGSILGSIVIGVETCIVIGIYERMASFGILFMDRYRCATIEG